MEDVQSRNSTSDRVQPGIRWWLVSGILTLAVVATIAVTAATAHRIMTQKDPLIHDLDDARYELAIFHLWLEELIEGDPALDVPSVWRHFELARDAVHGIGEAGDPDLSPLISRLLDEMKVLEELASVRTRKPEASGAGTAPDEEFDAAFKTMLETADTIEGQVEAAVAHGIQSFRILAIVVMVAAVIAGSAITVILHRYEQHRQHDIQRLNKTETRLRQAQAIGGFGTWEWNLKTGEEVWSDEVFHGLGVSPGEPDRAAFDAAIHTEDRDRVLAARRLAIAEGAPYGQEFRLIRPDGSVAHIHSVAKVERDEDGQPVRLMGTFQDITARKEVEEALRQSEQIFRQMFERNPAVMLLIDPRDGAIVDANPAAADYYGYPVERLKALRLFELEVGLTDGPSERREGGAHDSRHRLSSGDIRDVAVSSGPVSVGGRTYLHAIVHDVTDRNLYAEQLEESNANLQEFAYVASHDLQEPLRSVSSYLGLLQRDYGGRMGADADEFIGYAVDGAKRMAHLIRDLLAFSRIETQGKEPVPVEMAQVVNDAMTNLERALADSEAEVTIGEMPRVMGDRTQLTSLVQNVVGNAIKYAADDCPPVVHMEATRTDEGWSFAVSDNGIGIESRFLEQIFGVFKRLHPMGKYDGTGIGLAVCKRIIERHGGRIWVESELDVGSTFHFTLPAAS